MSKKNSVNQEYLSSKEVATLLGITDKRTVQKYLDELNVPVTKIGNRAFVKRDTLERRMVAAVC